MKPKSYSLVLLLCSAVIMSITAGCYGIIGSPPSGNQPPTTRTNPPIARAEVPTTPADAGPKTDAGPTTPESTQPPEGDPIPIAKCEIPEALQLRRLTRIEYQNTIRDLLGQDVDVKSLLPPDEQTFGFAVGEGVSLSLSQAYMSIAEETVAKVDLDKLLPCKVAEIDDACATTFIKDFGLRTYRRPLKQTEVDRATALYKDLQSKYDAPTAMRSVLHMFLQSPYFIYRIERGETTTDGKATKLNDYEIASRLSYVLWASTPDQTLYDAAAKGELRTKEQITLQARRMIQDPKARQTVHYFFSQWLDLEKLDNMSKSDKEYPNFNVEIADDLRKETEKFIDHVIWEGDGKLKTLLTARFTFLNERLAKHYGIDGVTGTEFRRVELPATQQRMGLLTQGSFLAIHANKDQSSPIHRGLFVRKNMLCQIPDPPPNDIALQAPDLDPNLSTRERFEQHRSDPSCSGCHMLLDPIGFGFEHFDAIGRFRDKENSRDIDATGHMHVTEDINGPFNGTVELAQKLSQSKQVQRCFVRLWYRYSFGREDTPNDACFVQNVTETFLNKDGDIRELLIAVVAHKMFSHLKGELAEPVGQSSSPLVANRAKLDCTAFSPSQDASSWLFLLSLLFAWIAIRRLRRSA
ncbi:MAG: DUF1592 domain-containing protein [Myxococcales bacterium]|nr:DUF1592 domain-containing protein [Myxococcales bacterium]